MKLRIIAVGKKMPAWIEAGFSEYARRMPRENSIELVELKPEKRGGGKTSGQIQEAERDRILAALPRHATVWALDEHGSQLTTLELAGALREWQGTGRDTAFVIGGADGLHQDVKQRADKLLALSRFTLPHGLVRVMLVEQLYRVWSVTHNHPYHRE
ncbi:ribosomal RNA large subunit methyltransferase H [Sulfuriferula plumbiphila]|uniref:Ribosomal RNA large subunit methyltransferase H n=1 Tax=Sulfuriferula plumbiphila TaxID=171865 RepID=A0A512L968_9PROT|nr:23S rRNA (pseudouridine(1915)-N(3))-methyltransferase RlmH [Sulfuriferula plumbiphila]BBP05612.1 ribosomal RNA large subunit methyltransferase H [Sulfuriferula plumbiphila]GEP30681.1 ribosomal RNA large subunit methyltransferase H [Sulfuriferula plumbiphila]